MILQLINLNKKSMKKILFSLALFVAVGATSWQVYSVGANNLTVYYGNNPESGICFSGDPKDYDGSCTNPKAPTQEYILEQIRLSQEREANLGR